MANTARQLLWPSDPDTLVRVVFLHVGQGASAIVLAADGSSYKSLLVDINLDPKNGGIDVPRLIKDLVGEDGLDVFVNTHPHNDHLCGLVDLSDEVEIGEVWHSGHVPGPKHCDRYKDLQEVIKKVKKAGGSEVLLQGSRSPSTIGEVDYYVLSPAEYVVDEIGDETDEVRYRRIHEHCAVLKFGSDDKWIMIPGDADRDAWELHITNYHKSAYQLLCSERLTTDHGRFFATTKKMIPIWMHSRELTRNM